MAPEQSENKVLVFYSYCHVDERHRKRLGVSLASLRRSGAIEEWYDRKIRAGDPIDDRIAEQLDAAQLILLLVSPEFIASEYCWGKEMTRALERNNASQARVVPIILRPTDFAPAPFARLMALPLDAKPVTTWTDRDKAWLNVAQGISDVVKEIAVGIASKQRAGSSSAVPSADEVKKSPRSTTIRGAKRKKTLTRSKRKRSARPLTVGTVKQLGERVALRPGGQPQRTIFDAQQARTLPGKIVRAEGKRSTRDPAVNETYEWLGTIYHFFWDVFKRDSIDGKGMPLIATVHYGRKFNNAFWNGKQMVIGDGDNQIFKRFTPLDVLGVEYTKGVLQYDTSLTYWQQSGALLTSIANCFGTLTKQYALKQTADKADWLVGEGLFTPSINGKALVSLASPGTAYNDSRIGKDPQPKHMRDYVRTSDDNGGVHINAGIPSHAFYLTAIALDGFAWEKAGRIWYDSMRDKQLKPSATFRDFARVTNKHARELYAANSPEAKAVRQAWGKVGIKI